MEAPQLSDRSRKRLVALLAEDRLDGERLLTRLREFRALEGVPTCSTVLHLLANLSLPEEEAERLLLGLNQHRRELAEILGRDPGLRVAAIDFLANVKGLLRNPTIVELSQLERTERSATTDALTDLYNRRYFGNALDIEIRRSRRYALALSLLMFDLDSFKPVNDLYGHPFGDLVLKRAGRVILRAVRESDLACRFGGEEFAVVLPETDRLGALAVGERVRRAVERNFASKPIQGRAVAMTLSGGVAAYPDDGADAKALIARADQALYLAKTRGKNRVIMHFNEQRRDVRYPVRESARATLVTPSGRSAREACALNISSGGALLATEQELVADDAVELELSENKSRWTVAGRVVRVEQPSAPAARRVAVAFDGSLPEECLHRSTLLSGAPRANGRYR
jgi:diguanylate cyclase (GGDEF)-like protein